MALVSTMILNSLVMSGEKVLGDTLDANERPYYLSRLNSMLDSWSNERLMIFTLSQTSFALTASTATYTIGNGGAFNMTRPTKIVDPCFIRDTQDADTPLTIIDAQAYGEIPMKSTDGAYPSLLFYDYGYSATSTATIKLYPSPSSGLTLFINTLQPLTNFSTVSHNPQLPPGYQDAIELNFAVRSAFGFRTLPREVHEAAKAAKAAIKSTNMPAPVARLDYGVGGSMRSSILTGP